MIKKDSIFLGLICGMLTPISGIYIYWLLMFRIMAFSAFISHTIQYRLVSPILSISLILNLGTFFLFIYLKRDLSAKGVLFATFVYGAVILLTKLGVF